MIIQLYSLVLMGKVTLIELYGTEKRKELIRMKKIVVSPDSFKGSLTANEVSEIITEEISQYNKKLSIEKIPLADGGEGTIEILESSGYGGKIQVNTFDPLLRLMSTSYIYSSKDKRAFIESAATIGLPLLSTNDRNPMNTSSFGLGVLIKDAIKRGCNEIAISLGGTATCDGGIGMLSALGYIFYDSEGNILSPVGENLIKIHGIDFSEVEPELSKMRFLAVCDVKNPLFGEIGAAKIYAPQKGATPKEVEILDKGLQNLSEIAVKLRIVNPAIAMTRGAGAAGGLGYAIEGFLNGEYISGIDFILDTNDFNNRIKGADLIITGEGRIDPQSLMGKVIDGVLRRAKNKNIPVVAIGGTIEQPEYLRSHGLVDIYSISNSEISLEKNMQRDVAITNLRKTVRKIISSHKKIFA